MSDETQRQGSAASHQVVIVGAGPTGLMLAAELALAKVDVVLIERRLDHALVGTRARGLNARTLEVLDQRGVVERFLGEGYTAQIASFAQVPLDISDCPTRHNYGLALFQTHVERILTQWVAELAVPVRRGCSATGFVEDDAGVCVELSDGQTLRAQYLVGCDGGRSRVRKRAGIDFVGWDASVSYLIAEVEMAGAPPFGVNRDGKGVYALGPAEGGRVAVVLREETLGRSAPPTLDELRAALVALYGADFGLRRAHWLSWFTDASRQAATYRKGRVLLAGDAAHIHSPVGGQGLNTGVQDAVNLGWKLAQVVHGTAPADLLDSYHAERHPVGARVLRNTMALTALDRVDPRSTAVRDAMGELLAMQGPRRRFGAMMSGLDIHYDLGPGHALLGRRVPDLDLRTPDGPRRVFELLHAARPILLDLGGSHGIALGPWSDRVCHVTARCDDIWALPAIGEVPAPSAVLIRPDGHAAWVGDGSDDGSGDGLRDALRRWFGPAEAR